MKTFLDALGFIIFILKPVCLFQFCLNFKRSHVNPRNENESSWRNGLVRYEMTHSVRNNTPLKSFQQSLVHKQPDRWMPQTDLPPSKVVYLQLRGHMGHVPMSQESFWSQATTNHRCYHRCNIIQFKMLKCLLNNTTMYIQCLVQCYAFLYKQSLDLQQIPISHIADLAYLYLSASIT